MSETDGSGAGSEAGNSQGGGRPSLSRTEVKESLRELLGEIPAFRAVMRSGPGESSQVETPATSGGAEGNGAGEGSTSAAAAGTANPPPPTGSGHGLGAPLDPEEAREVSLPTFNEPVTGSVAVQGPGNAGERMETGEKGSDGVAPFILGEALPVVPAKLVRKILKGEFVDMAELLKDNMEAERRRAGADGEVTPRLGRREIPDILSWLHCFSLYAAVVVSRYPDKMKDLLAYQALMVAEHRRCGGRGWLLYDSAFRQQFTSLEAADFSKLNQSLYLTTFAAYGGKGQSCSSCLLSDHSQEDCALRPLRPTLAGRLGGSSSGEERRKRRRPCYAWNDGKCAAPYCRFDHICVKCHGDHRRVACKGGQEQERGGGRPRGPDRAN